MKRPLAYITAHWGDNEFENTENAAKYCRLRGRIFPGLPAFVPAAVFEGQHPPGA